MLAKTILAAMTVFVGATASAAALECAAPVLQVTSVGASAAQFTMHCEGKEHLTVAPEISLAGEMPAQHTPPYLLKADYRIDVRNLMTKAMNDTGRADEVVSGQVAVSVTSLSALPASVGQKLNWQPKDGVLSVEEKPGRWHVYALQVESDTGEAGLVDSGYASTAYQAGKADLKIPLGREFSRFASKGALLPVVDAKLAMYNGTLAIQVGDTRVANQKALQDALLQLDKKPQDISRAWAFAARAKFLGLTNEVLYAEQKVAAHNPQMLEEFQHDVAAIVPNALPRQ